MQAVRAGRILTEASHLVLLVGLEVAFEPVPLGRVVVIAFPREDMRGDTVEEPTVVGNHHSAARELEQRVFEGFQGLDVQIVGGLVEQQQVAALLQGQGQVQTVALTTGQHTSQLLLIGALEGGHIVRREYAAGRGVPVVVAVEQDPRGDGWALTLAYAKALGALRAGAIKTTFKEETETDLFGEQNVLMGGVNKLVEMGFEVLTDAGYQPEIAYFEVCHELKMLVDLMNEGGLNKARWSCSDTAQYGDYVNTVINEDCRKRMEYHLQRIQDGSFAKEFIDDQDAGAPHFKELQEKYSNERIETVGPKLRAMFSWNKDGVKDADEANSFTGKIARAQVQ